MTKKILLIIIATFICFSVHAKEKYQVKLQYKDKHAKTVNLVGDFNEWEKEALSYKKVANGLWEIELNLPAGEYAYKIIVDGKKWIVDPEAPQIKTEQYTNSLLSVGSKDEIDKIKKKSGKSNDYNKKQALILANQVKDFTKIKLPKEKNIFSFAVLGDSRTNLNIYKAVVNDLKTKDVKFVANTGDIVGKPTRYSEWVSYLEITNLLPCPVFVAVGNHEVDDEESQEFFKKMVKHPGNELYYNFAYQNVELFVLDSEIPKDKRRVDGVQLDWLTKTLKASKATHKFAFVHRPAYPSGYHKGESLDRHEKKRDAFVAVLKQYEVKALFVGHEHLYSRTNNNGLVQIITAGAGAELYSKTKENGFHHYILVRVNNDKVSAEVVKLDETNNKFSVFKKFDLN